MKFTKMHGCGNDYVYVDCTEHMLANPSAAAIAVSDRHFGVGGDGLILICPSDKADFRAEAGPVVGLGRDVPGLGEGVIGQTVTVAGKPWTMTCLSMGNPHAVVWVDDVAALPLEQIGPAFEHAPYFPDRVNTEFVQVLNDHEINMRVWERGSGETLACGTGACASVAACYLNGRTGAQVMVHLRGGDLAVELGEDGCIYMTGPATTVFEGEING